VSRGTRHLGGKSTAAAALAALAFVVSVSGAQAAAGDLDATFGTGGKVTTDLASSDAALGVAVQSDGKIVAAGNTCACSTGGSGAFAVVRYNADGTLDTSFGGGGKVSSDFTAGTDAASAVILQTDGKVVAAGFSNYGPHAERYKAALARYEADGSLDGSFGSGGKVSASLDMCRVPRVKGKRLRDARPAIQRSHCSVGRIRYRFSRRVRRKHVISQRPRPGSLGVDRARVRLTVSKGARRR
jgi:uncharacterized delta-60 repeat protein